MTDVVADLADIPRLYTALAEWGACVVYVLVGARRHRAPATIGLLVAGLIALAAVQLWAGTLPIVLWIPGMLAAVAVMYALLRTTLRATAWGAGFFAARAFVLAELTASLHWQLDRFYLADAPTGLRVAVMLVTYAVVLALAWLAERRHFARDEILDVGWRDLVSTLAIAAVTFGVSNLGFATADTAFSGRGEGMLYIRTLVDFSGCIALYAQREMRREWETRKDAEAMAQLLRSQHEQYETSRRTMDEIARLHHDMTHHLEALRAETDADTRERMLDDLGTAIREYGDQVRTGNRIIDTVLTTKRMRAREDGVEVSYVVDGGLLDFLAPLDVTTILGNALDNAIEAARRIPDEARRSVRAAVFAQEDFVMVRVENTFEGALRREGGRLVSTKDGTGHGYGLRNIEAAVERYDGSVSITAEDGWFSLRMLFPR